MQVSNRKRHALVGLLISAGLGVQCHQLAQGGEGPTGAVNVVAVRSAALASHVAAADPLEHLARTDPLAFLQRCRDRYDQAVQDYSCTFVKQERIGNRLTPEQVIQVKFREAPFSTNMRWTANPDDAAQVTYIAGRWRDDDGQDLAWCKPAGAIASLFIDKIRQPIHGRRAAKASRRSIDQFGFSNTLDLIVHYSEKAARDGELELRYTGAGFVDGRPTYVFERLLPYTGQEVPYPDRLLIFHIDREWLLPTACYSYADDAGTELLGKYLLTSATFNVGFTDADFGPESIGS